MIYKGFITEFRYTKLHDGKYLEVKVNLGDRVSDWLPVKEQVSLFSREHNPVAIDDQVIVFEDDMGDFVDRNLAYEKIPLHELSNENTYIKDFKDGTIFIHNSKTKKITLETTLNIEIISKNVKIQCSNKVDINCKTANIKASSVNVDSSNINLGLGGDGVITGACICPYTGSSHSDKSSTVKATK